ncbi:MAG TPA: ATP-binding protein [Casimicrobiaceae bacterium]|nr:ATP-binding protein [Casimicrobiaceae bacterium]
MMTARLIKRWQPLVDWWSQLIAAAPRAEFNQAKLRVGLIGLVYAYLLVLVYHDGEVSAAEQQSVLVGASFVIVSIAIAARVLLSPANVSIPRRVFGMVCDNAATTYFLLQFGEKGAIVIFVYLFITFGNGLRYDRRHMNICQAMALLGFALVVWLSPFWSQHLWLAGTFGFLLAVLPFYVGSLAEKIKEEKRRADEANQAKGRFLANVSHEMRTPLNGVIAMADVLRETSLNDAQSEIVTTLSNSANLLLAQIEDVLDIAKIEAGRIQIEVAPFDFGTLLTNAIKVVLPQARYKGLAVHTNIAPDASRWFVGDENHLRQVLLNLLSNAVKFTENGEVTVRARVLDTVNGVAKVRVEVQDTGIGIAPDKQVAIFEAFAQADDSITRVYGGTGLGTTIAKQLITLMGGQLGLHSVQGVGSTFWFEVPLPISEPRGLDLTAELTTTLKTAGLSQALAASQGPRVRKIHGARVLVADDNPTNQRVTELILQSGGHVVTIVENGEEALDALERGGFDVALFDLSMPGVSGLEALKLYQFTTPRPIPVLILSANVTTDVIAECQRAGAAEFVRKPIRASILLDAIERQLAGADDSSLPSAPIRPDDRPTLTVVNSPSLDARTLGDLAKLSTDPTFVERLIQGFRADCDRLVQEIKTGLAQRRYESVKDAAHALRGGAGSIGATQLMQLATRLEKANYETTRQKGRQWVEDLSSAAERTMSALDAYLDAQRQQKSSLQ